MGLVTWGVSTALPFGDGWWNQLARLASLTLTGAVVVFVVARQLRMPEWRWALGLAETDTAPPADAS
jgi:hypothetical protein